MVYYNDNDPYCCRVLRARIADGGLPDGFVDDRDIREIRGSDLSEYRQIHLFSGIGGFPLGFKWAGVPDDFSIITGGFPCQDISNAGKRAGIDGDRSGLWSEMCRLVREVRPRFVVVENVAALLGRGLDRVLGDLAACGYDAEWNCIPASAVGAPHRRDRLWIVAHATNNRTRRREQQPQGGEGTGDVADAEILGGQVRPAESERPGGLAGCGDVADTERSGRQPQGRGLLQGRSRQRRGRLADCGAQDGTGPWSTEPDVGRVAHGIPARVDRLRGLGNSIVPQIAEWLGRQILGVTAPTEKQTA